MDDAEVFLFKPARIRLGIEKDKQGVYPGQKPDLAHPAAGSKAGGTGTAGQAGSPGDSVAGGGNESAEAGRPRRPRSMARTTLVIGKGLGRRLLGKAPATY